MPYLEKKQVAPQSRFQKPLKPVAVPKTVDKGAFVKKGWLSRLEAVQWMMEQPDLYKIYPKKPGESNWQRARRAVEDIFPTKPVGAYVEKTGKFELQRRRRELDREQRISAPAKKKFTTKRLGLFDKFTGK